MKPSEHPEFFRLPAPQGRSRESTIVLDRTGRFFHDGELVEKASLALAFAKWLKRHPENGRYILENGYDWTYVTVEGTPFFVTAFRPPEQKSPAGGARPTREGPGTAPAVVQLSDGTEEPLDPETLTVDHEGVVYCSVKGGVFEARFTPGAQISLAPVLAEAAGGEVVLRLAGRDYHLPPRVKNQGSGGPRGHQTS